MALQYHLQYTKEFLINDNSTRDFVQFAIRAKMRKRVIVECI